MNNTIQLNNKEAVPVLSIRTKAAVGDLPAVMGQAFGAIAGYLGECGQAPAGAPFAAYYNMDMNNLDIEIGFPVSKKVSGKGNIQPSEIPAGEQVSCFFKGSYEDMKTPYEEINKWLTQNGYVSLGTSYEFYLNDPSQVPPNELETLIMFPVKKA